MKIELTHDARITHLAGEKLTVNDEQAQRLIDLGFAKQIKETKQAAPSEKNETKTKTNNKKTTKKGE